jgi:hypothetical protein
VLPKRADTLVATGLSTLHLEWGRGRHAEGRQVAVIVGCKEGGVVFVDGAWEFPLSCAAFRASLQSRREIAAKMSASSSGKIRTPEHCANLSRALTGKKLSPETITKRTASRKANETPERYEKRVAAATGYIKSAETRAKLSAAGKGRKMSPEAIAKRVASRLKNKIERTAGGA